jgi:purine-binding chemotaxis protein CheW
MTAQPRRFGLAGADVVTFRLSGEVLAVPAADLREVLEPVAATRVPGAPDFVTSLLNVRGAVVPLADLRVPLRMPRSEAGADARILVLELPLAGQDAVVGILADSVHEVTRIEPDALEDIPPVGTRWPPRFVAAVGRWCGEFVTIPDLPAIFSDALSGQDGHPTQPGTCGARLPHDPEAL